MSDFPFPTQESLEEQQPSIDFHFEDVSLASFQPESYIDWVQKVVTHHQCVLEQVQYVFCSDDYLHQMNVEFLDHDTFTDIITFPYNEPPTISGDIFISLDRVTDNAKDRGIDLELELRRVIIHGVLHLCGYGDKSEVEAKRMRELEEEALEMMVT